MFKTFKFIIWCYLVHFNYAARRPVSPCPNVFQFEGEPENDRWSGVINFSSNIELAGLTYKIQLDKPAQLLVSWDGEVRSDDNILFHVNNQYRVQRPGETGRAQIMVKFDPAYGPPGISKIVINGNTVCSITGEGRPSGQNNGNRVPGIVLSVDSTTERIDPSFENEDSRPDYSSGSSNGNTNYGNNFNQGSNYNPNRVPTGNNYGNQNIPSNNYGNSNGPYGATNVNSGSSGNPNYSNSNQANNNGPPDVQYPYNPPVQSGNNYVNNRPQFPDNNFNSNSNPNQGTNWQNNNGGGNNGFSNPPNSPNNNPQGNSPYNGTIYSANNPQQILQLFNNLLNQQQNPNASSPAFVVAILPVPSSPDPVISRVDPPATTESLKYKPTTFSTTTTSTTVTYPTTSSTSNTNINRIRTNTTASNTKTSNNNNNNNNNNTNRS